MGILRWIFFSGGDPTTVQVNTLDFPAKILTTIDIPASICTIIDFSGLTAVDVNPLGPRVGDIGTKVRLQVLDEIGAAVDVSSATVTIRLRNGTIVKTFSGVLDSTGADGKVYFLSLVDTWFREGMYIVQAFAVIGAKQFYSLPYQFEVGGNL